MLLWSKLKRARELLEYSQGDAAIHSGIAQKDISLLEGGKKKFIPEEYIHFLYKHGIDINSLYDPTKEVCKIAQKSDDTPPDTEGVSSKNTGAITTTPIAKSGGIAANTAKPDTPTDTPTTFLQPKIVTVDREGNENIALVPVRAAAGYLLGYSDPEYFKNLPSYSLPGLHHKTHRAFEVSGDSMWPTLENKEIVIGQWVEKLEYIREDRVHVVVTKNNGVVIKRLLNRIEKYGYIVAKSDAVDNRNLYPNIEIYPDDIIEIWYCVMHLNSTFRHPTDMYKRVNNLEADLAEVLRLLKEKNITP